MTTQNLTSKELELYNWLVKTGDSKELALNTVISEREKPESNEFYKNAYEN